MTFPTRSFIFRISHTLPCIAGLLLLASAAPADAASPFTYQGRLNASGGPASGAHDFEFGLYDAVANGNQVGTTVSLNSISVDGGLFSVQLDFGNNAFASPSRYLEMVVRPQGNGAYTPLAPRQPVTPAPSAHHAFSIASGAVGMSALDTTVGQALVPAGSYALFPSETSVTGYTYTGMTVNVGDSSPNTWTTKVSMPTPRGSLAAAAVNGKIYALGGGSASSRGVNEEYDPATNTWTAKAPMPTGRGYLAAAAVDGKVYAIGGVGGDANEKAVNEEYDPATNVWTQKAPMPTARYAHAAAAVNGKIYALGGAGGTGNVSAVNEEYNPATNTWTAKASIPTGRIALAAAVVFGKIYALGGYRGGFSAVNEQYDPATNTWTAKAPMPTPRNELAAAAAYGKLYTMGGGNNNASFLAVNEEYNPATNTWTAKAAMPTARTSPAAVAAVNGKLYVLGGSGPDISAPFAVNEQYVPPPLFVHLKE